MGDHRFEYGKHLVGRAVNKKFKGFGRFVGKIVSFNSARGFYKVRYDDGDAEELDLEEVKGVLMEEGRKRKRGSEEPVEKKTKGGKEMQEESDPVEKKTRGGKETKEESNPVEKKTRGRKKRKQESIPVEKKTRGRKETKQESNPVEKKTRGRKKSKQESNPVEKKTRGGKETEQESNTVEKKTRGGKETEQESNPVEKKTTGGKEAEQESNPVEKKTRGGNEAEQESNPVEKKTRGGKEAEQESNRNPVEKKTRGGKETEQESSLPLALPEPADQPRKRRKRRGRDSNAGPPRRSSRQAAVAAAKSGKGNGKGVEGARVSGDGVRRRRRRLATKLPLPSSSGDLLVPEESVPSLFYVYTTLRSFSKLLFLSPFGLQDFVGALNCEEANSLMDHVHLALLQTLRRHLEFIVPDEGPAAAAAIRCLRHLDWNLLDRITWPVYLVEYLISQGFSKISGQKLGCLKLCDREYYTTSVSMKLTVLEFLCNEVMETEEIRPEISTRLGDVEIDGEDNLINALASVAEKKPRRGRRRILKHCSKEGVILDSNKTDDQESSISNPRTGVNTGYAMSMVKFQGNSGHIQNKRCETARSEGNDVENLNSDECCLCRMDGVLICCDGCPAAYHSRCVGVSKDALPEGDWYCPECLVKKAPRGFAVLKGLQGAEFLGMDAHGRIYFSICGYLLVADSATDPVTTYYYYNKDDSMKVLDILDTSTPLYVTIHNAMVQSWDKSRTMSKASLDKADKFFEKCTSESSIISVSHSLVHQEQESAPLIPSVTSQKNAILKNDSFLKGRLVENFVAGGKEDVEMMDAYQSNGDALIASSESSLETSLNVDAQVSEKNHEQQIICSNAPCSVDFTKNCLVQGQQLIEADTGNATFQVKQQPERSEICTMRAPGQMVLVDSPLKRRVTFQVNAYENQYILGDVAASAAANLAVNIADKENSVQRSSKRSLLIATTEQRKIREQMKAFSKAAAQFSWPCLTKKYAEVQKEKCGWCHFCKSSTSNLSGCILHMASENAAAGALGGAVAFTPSKYDDGHFPDIVAYILYMEDRLYGLLGGPWENPLYRKYWRKYLEHASSIAEVKHSLLELELSIKPIALSADWCKAVDDANPGVSTSQISASVAGQSPKRGRPRRNSMNWSRAVNDATSGASTSQVSGSVPVHTPKRGRPRKNLVNSCKTVDNATSGASASQISANVAAQTPKRGRPRKIFVNWFKSVNDATPGVSTSQISVSVSDQTPKRGRPRRNSAADKTSPALVEATSFGVNWWRGCRLLGRAHCQSFLPYIIARRAGRQAGLRKIPGICYAEDLEIPRRSKRYTWRAAVEMARNVSQLALQVRILSACIKWNDIVSVEDFPRSKGGEEKGTSGYNKAAICAKSSEKGVIKYLVDFGKQKTIPIHIVKHGIKHEDAEKGKIKYWISENFVPLFLLKEFRKKPLRGRPKKDSNKFPKFLFRLSRTSNSDVFSFLLDKAEGRHKCSCGHCKMDVLIWKAVQCQICEGSFHRKCALPILDSSDCKLACYKCYNIKHHEGDTNMYSEKNAVSAHKRSKIAKEPVKIGMSSPGGKRKKYKSHQSLSKTEGAVNLDLKTLNANSDKFDVATHKSSMLVKEPVENGISLPDKKQKKYKRQEPVENGLSLPDKKQKKYKRHQSHSEIVAEQKINSITKSLVRKVKRGGRLDGLLWKKKRTGELGKEFRQTKLLLPCQSSMDASKKPFCFLCSEAYNSQLIYVGCESCTEWFHGDAFGLTMENVADLIAFKCHKCRKRNRPACPYAKNLEGKIPDMKIKTDNGEMLDAAENKQFFNSIPIPISQEPITPKRNCTFFKDYLQGQSTNCLQIRKEDDLGETSMGSEMMSGVIDSSIKDYLQDKVINCAQSVGEDKLRETFMGSEMENNHTDSSFKYYLQDEVTNFLQNGLEDKSRQAQIRSELKNNGVVQSIPGFQTQSMLSYMELLASDDDKIENLFDLSQDGVLSWSANLLPIDEAVNGSQLHGLVDGPNLSSRATISQNNSEKVQSHLANTFPLESFVNQPYSTGTEIKSDENKMEKCPNCDLKEVPLDLQCRMCGTAIHFHCHKLAPTGCWSESGWLCGCCEAGFVQG
ncbi:hypothetical protein SUGI_1147980 [Cryptomeria japonica]|nr:hypothetical protein SUGI_1147980 [Cryptomeria japonica]